MSETPGGDRVQTLANVRAMGKLLQEAENVIAALTTWAALNGNADFSGQGDDHRMIAEWRNARVLLSRLRAAREVGK